MSEPIIVHVLHHGLPLCRFTSMMPCDWPLNHKWVGLEDEGVGLDVTCADCRSLMKSEERSVTPEEDAKLHEALRASGEHVYDIVAHEHPEEEP